jgi:DNA-binding NtrC family response regulator
MPFMKLHEPGVSPTKRILVADEYADTRDVNALSLSRAGYVVRTAASVAEALKLCDEEYFDLLLGELGMPDGGGLDMMRRVAVRGHIHGIAYTGYGYEQDVASARAAGFYAYLIRPLDCQVLLRTVARVLEEESLA